MSGDAITLKITARGDRRYWLKVAVSQSTTLQALDGFLRGIWLECCRHLSAFSIPGREGSEVNASLTVGAVFSHVNMLHYVYDFGSSTELIIRRVKAASADPGGIALLGRNELPAAFCEECGGPATSICTECSMTEGGLYCDEDAAVHACGEEFLLPFVNSPRVGVCGYGG